MSEIADVKAVMPEVRSAAYSGRPLVFIGGCPRSGTTWLQRMLSCHPSVRTGVEAHIFEHYLGPVQSAWRRSARGSAVTHGLAGYFTEAEFKTVLADFLASLLRPFVARLEPGQLFVDKTPSNALYLHEITEALPECRFIHVLRDPRDVVASLLAASRSWGTRWAPKKAHGAAHMWKQYIRTVREASAELPSWQFHEVRYEDLHTQPHRSLKECSEFLGLTWSEDELANAISQNEPPRGADRRRGTAIPAEGELRERFGSTMTEPTGFVRKAQVGSWKTDLTIVDKFWVWLLLRREMAANGYRWRLLP